MSRLLIITTNDIQTILKLSARGNTSAQIVYDEDQDGELRTATRSLLGGLKRVSNVVGFDQTTRDAHDAALAARAQRAQDKLDRLQRIKNNYQNVTTIAQVKDVLVDMVEHMGLDK